MKTIPKNTSSSFFMFSMMLFLLFSCAGNQGTMTAEEEQEYQALVQLVENQEFEIENTWVIPQGGNSMNLSGNPNYIRIKGDQAEIFLPYFGVRHSGGGYRNDGGIIYEGPLQDVEIEQRKDDQNVRLSFTGKHNSEQLRFFITLHPNGKTNTSVTSSERGSISYRGDVQELRE